MHYTESERKLAKFFVEREGEGVLDTLKAANLVSEGYLDSLDMVVLAVFIEEQFGKKIDLVSEGTFHAMQDFNRLHALVTS
jgi:acyl carrier protein